VSPMTYAQLAGLAQECAKQAQLSENKLGCATEADRGPPLE